jgi:hypothetical protein
MSNKLLHIEEAAIYIVYTPYAGEAGNEDLMKNSIALLGFIGGKIIPK